jgi:hypothetical protein
VVPAIASPLLPYLAAAPFVVHDYRIAHLFFHLRVCVHFFIVARYFASSLHNALLLRNTPTGWVGRIDGNHSRSVLELYAGHSGRLEIYGYLGVALAQ